MSRQEFGIGIDPAEKDGTLTIFGEDEETAFKLTMNWKAAAIMMVSLHRTIHAAAATAGIGFAEVHDHMDRIYNEMFEELEADELDGDHG